MLSTGAAHSMSITVCSSSSTPTANWSPVAFSKEFGKGRGAVGNNGRIHHRRKQNLNRPFCRTQRRFCYFNNHLFRHDPRHFNSLLLNDTRHFNFNNLRSRSRQRISPFTSTNRVTSTSSTCGWHPANKNTATTINPIFRLTTRVSF